MSVKRIRAAWSSMKQRCQNPKSRSYHNYGARGIKVCEEWRDDFKAFYDWSMNNGYASNLTIDRIDSNGNYEPSNCRWATKSEQGRNKRNNRVLCVDGKEMTITQWAKLSGIKYTVIESRIKAGWELKDAIFLPSRTTCNYKKYYKKGDKK